MACGFFFAHPAAQRYCPKNHTFSAVLHVLLFHQQLENVAYVLMHNIDHVNIVIITLVGPNKI